MGKTWYDPRKKKKKKKMRKEKETLRNVKHLSLCINGDTGYVKLF